MRTATSAEDSKEKKLPTVFISQTKTPMTAKQFWKEHFPEKKATIFEVMTAYADHVATEREEALKKKLDDKLQTAEAARIDAQTNVKSLLSINNGQKEEITRIKKEFADYRERARESFADGDL